MTTRSEYLTLRHKYQPDQIKLILIAESPPASGRYFYNPEGVISEPLFAALMKRLDVEPKTKGEGLDQFRAKGWVLVDATYEPVNTYSARDRNAVIVRDYPSLRADLLQLNPSKLVPLLLIKANICELLEPPLRSDGFTVLNRGRSIYFPSHGRQTEFHEAFSDVLVAAS